MISEQRSRLLEFLSHYGHVLIGVAVVAFVVVPWWIGAATIWNWLF